VVPEALPFRELLELAEGLVDFGSDITWPLDGVARNPQPTSSVTALNSGRDEGSLAVALNLKV